eukprot:gene17159-23470_t
MILISWLEGASYTVPACSTPGMDLYEDFLKIEKRTMARPSPRSSRRACSLGNWDHCVISTLCIGDAGRGSAEGGGRFKKFFIENIEALQRKLRLPEFHNGFLLLAAEIVEFITEPECYGPTDVGPELPDLVRSLFCDIRTRVEEELGFAHGSLFFQIVAEGGGGVYEDGDMTLVEVFIKAVVELAVQRALTVGQYLTTPSCANLGSNLQGLTELPSLSAKLVDYLLGYHLDLCFGTHISVLVACCVYAVTKAARADLPFRVLLPEVTDILGLESGSQPVSPIFRSVSISGPGGPKEGQSEEFGDIRTFYNRLFISRVEGFVRKLLADRGSVAGAARCDAHLISIPGAASSAPDAPLPNPSHASSPSLARGGKMQLRKSVKSNPPLADLTNKSRQPSQDPVKKQFAFEPYQADGISEVSGENRNILLAKEKRFRRQKQIPMTIIPDNPEFEGTVPNAMGYPRGIPQPVASQQTQESQETQDEFSFELQNVPTGGLEVSSHAKLPRFLIDELRLTENQPARNYSTIRYR